MQHRTIPPESTNQTPPEHTASRLIRLPEVLFLTGRQRTATLDDVKAGKFPQPVRVGRATLYVEAEVRAWIADRVRESRKA